MTSDMPLERRGSWLGTAAIFLFGAPLLITLVAGVLWAFGIGRGSGSIGPNTVPEAFAWYAVIIVFVGWPAIIGGALLMPWLSPRLANRWTWLGVSAGVYAVLTVCSAMLIGKGGDFNEMLSLIWVFLLFGGGAGAACALVTDRFRPRRVA